MNIQQTIEEIQAIVAKLNSEMSSIDLTEKRISEIKAESIRLDNMVAALIKLVETN